MTIMAMRIVLTRLDRFKSLYVEQGVEIRVQGLEVNRKNSQNDTPHPLLTISTVLILVQDPGFNFKTQPMLEAALLYSSETNNTPRDGPNQNIYPGQGAWIWGRVAWES